MFQVQILTRRCPVHFMICIRKCPHAVLHMLIKLKSHQKMSVFRCISLFGLGWYFLLSSSLKDVGNYLTGDTLFVIKWGVFRRRNLYVLALLHIGVKIGIKYCVFFNFTLRYQKISERCREPILRPKPMRPFLIYVRVLYPSVSVGRLVGKYAIHRFPFRTDGIRCFLYLFPIHSAFFSIYSHWKSILFFRKFSCSFTADWIVGAQTSAQMFSDVA